MLPLACTCACALPMPSRPATSAATAALIPLLSTAWYSSSKAVVPPGRQCRRRGRNGSMAQRQGSRKFDVKRTGSTKAKGLDGCRGIMSPC